MKLMVTCPCCDEEFEIDDDIEVGEVVRCTTCDNELEVLSLDPIALVEWDEEEK